MRARHLFVSVGGGVPPNLPPNARILVTPDFPDQPLPADRLALPNLNAAARASVADHFCDIIDRLHRANRKNPAWWYTWLSCQDRFNLSLLDRLEMLARLNKALRSQFIGPLALECPGPAFATVVKNVAEAAGWSVEVLPGKRQRLGIVRRWRQALAHPLRWWWAARGVQATAFSVDAEELVVTLFGASLLRQASGQYDDIYFGSLLVNQARAGRRVAVMGIPFTDVPALTRWAATLPLPAIAIGQVVGLGAIVSAAWQASRFRLVMDGLASEERDLVHETLGNLTAEVMLGLVVERATAACLAANPRARVLTLAENNPWERAVAVAAAAAWPRRAVTGYLHCAVIPAHLKYRFLPAEDGWRPCPDVICTTGPAARDMAKALSGNGGDRFVAACALRGTNLDDIPRRTVRPEKIRTVLVLLEGLATMVPFIRFLEHCARTDPDLPHFIIRCHPALPVPEMAALAGVAIGGNGILGASEVPDLVTDLARVDAVFYAGSTAALTAAWIGIPLLRFSYGTLLSDDPLFGCQELKAEVCTREGLRIALAAFAALDGAEYQRQVDALRAVVRSILAPATPESLAPFFWVPSNSETRSL